MEYVISPYSSAPPPFAIWENAFNHDELAYLRQLAKSSARRAEVGFSSSGMVNNNVRRSNIDWLTCNNETVWVFKKLAHIVSTINAEHYRYNISGFGEALQLTNYNSEDSGMYGWHQDYGRGFSRKLSLVCQLTDPSEYEGGNLELFTSVEPIVIRKQLGLICVFPSFTVHQVTPVTKGTRQSMVSWITGEMFK